MTDPLADTTDLAAYQAGEADLAMDIANGLVRSYCGWHIAPSSTEEVTVDGSGGVVQFLPTMHLTDVSDVSNDGTALDIDDVMWSAVGYLKLRGRYWSCEPRGVVATITHGYEDVPAEVLGVVLDVASLVREVQASATIEAQTAEPFPHRFAAVNPDGSPAEVRLTEAAERILIRYKLPALP